MSRKPKQQPIDPATPTPISGEHRECSYCGTIYPTAHYGRCPGCDRKSPKDRILGVESSE